MALFKWTLPLSTIAMLVIGLAGCNSSQVTEPGSTLPSAEIDGAMDHEGMNYDGHDMHDHSAHSGDQKPEEISAAKSDMEKMMETLASFSEEDKASAMKQHFCPVSGEMLGVMGIPKKVDVNGQLAWICCDGCKDKLLADSEKYLAKLKQSAPFPEK